MHRPALNQNRELLRGTTKLGNVRRFHQSGRTPFQRSRPLQPRTHLPESLAPDRDGREEHSVLCRGDVGRRGETRGARLCSSGRQVEGKWASGVLRAQSGAARTLHPSVCVSCTWKEKRLPPPVGDQTGSQGAQFRAPPWSQQETKLPRTLIRPLSGVFWRLLPCGMSVWTACFTAQHVRSACLRPPGLPRNKQRAHCHCFPLPLFPGQKALSPPRKGLPWHLRLPAALGGVVCPVPHGWD